MTRALNINSKCCKKVDFIDQHCIDVHTPKEAY